jgi:predicted methyltransferase
MKIESALKYSHTILSKVISPGDSVIDATTGNGNDTEFLAQSVKNDGHVYAFDIQTQAIETTKQRLSDKNLIHRVTLINDGHENILKYVKNPIKAAIFNLGYLPGGDKNIITQPQKTITALKSCLSLLDKNGIIVVVIYYGHNGGLSEKEALMQWTSNLDQKQYTVLQYQFINQINCPPILLAIQKNK